MSNSEALFSHVSAALVNAVLLPYSLKMGLKNFFFFPVLLASLVGS